MTTPTLTLHTGDGYAEIALTVEDDGTLTLDVEREGIGVAARLTATESGLLSSLLDLARHAAHHQHHQHGPPATGHGPTVVSLGQLLNAAGAAGGHNDSGAYL